MHLQGSLLGLDEPAVDPSFAGLRHVELDDRTWLDHLPGWLAGHEQVFDHLYHELAWRQRTVTMYDRRLPEPRLTAWWMPSDGPEALPVLGDTGSWQETVLCGVLGVYCFAGFAHEALRLVGVDLAAFW